MTYKIKWTPKAEEGLRNILDYLYKEWTYKEVLKFLISVDKFLKLLQQFPQLLKIKSDKKNLYRGPINKFTIITYKVYRKSKTIQLISVTGSKQIPE